MGTSQTERKEVPSKQLQRKRKKEFSKAMLTESREESDNLKRLSLFQNNFSTISTATRPFETINSRSISEAERELTVKIGPELNGYMLNKFKKYIGSSSSARKRVRSLFGTENPENSTVVQSDIKDNNSYVSCGSCCKTVKKKDEGQSCILKNAKERVMRLMELKKVKES